MSALTLTKDDFGNTRISDPNTTAIQISDAVLHTDKKKGVIIVGVKQGQIDEYNQRWGAQDGFGKALFQGINKDGKTVHLVPQESPCPILSGGVVRGAGVVVVIKRGEKFYVAFIKDKSKPVFTAPGGVCEKDEEFLDGAIREVKEETNGDITLSRHDCYRLATIKMESSYYEIEVDDTYTSFGTVLEEGDFVDYLIENEEKRYDNIEIERIKRFELDPQIVGDSEKISSSVPKGVSKLHWLLAYANLAHYFGKELESCYNGGQLRRVKSIRFD